MSIYATLWKLKFPTEGDEHLGCEWIEVTAQAVPPHIGSPTSGNGYEDGDPYGIFLPPPVEIDVDGLAKHDRAVVFVTEYMIKGTERSGQEYLSPLLVLTGGSMRASRLMNCIGAFAMRCEEIVPLSSRKSCFLTGRTRSSPAERRSGTVPVVDVRFTEVLTPR